MPSHIYARIIFSFRSEKLPLFNSRFRRAFFCGGIGNALRRINLYWRAAAHISVAALFNGALRRKKRKKRASKNPTVSATGRPWAAIYFFGRCLMNFVSKRARPKLSGGGGIGIEKVSARQILIFAKKAGANHWNVWELKWEPPHVPSYPIVFAASIIEGGCYPRTFAIRSKAVRRPSAGVKLP